MQSNPDLWSRQQIYTQLLTRADEAEAAREDLIKKIKAVEGLSDVESPISIALDREKMMKSGDPEKRQIAEVLNAVGELKWLVEQRSFPNLLAVPNLYAVNPYGQVVNEYSYGNRNTRFPMGNALANLTVQTYSPENDNGGEETDGSEGE